MDRRTMAKVVAAIIFGGGGAAMLAEMARKEKMEKKKINDRGDVSPADAIVVSLSRNSLLRDIPLPRDQRKITNNNGEKLLGASPEIKDERSVSDAEDIEKRKKEILMASKSGKFDFFGKVAATVDKEDDKKIDDEQIKSDGKHIVSDKVDNATEAAEGGDVPEKSDTVHQPAKKKDPEDNLPPRNELGQFTSPTDPTGVRGAEKDAGALDYLMERAKMPILYTGGAFASLYLASKITDAINKNRVEESEDGVEKSRKAYISKLNGVDNDDDSEEGKQEKVAGLLDSATTGAIAAFLIPGAMTYYVVKKIMENRRLEKEKTKSFAKSMPDEKTFLYKVSEDCSYEVSPKTVLAMLYMNKRLIEGSGSGIQKSAGWFDNFRFNASPYDVDTAKERLFKHLSNPENDADLLEMAKAYEAGDYDKAKSVAAGMIPLGERAWHSKAFLNPDVIKSLREDPRMATLINNRFADPTKQNTWGAWGDQLVDKNLAKKFKPGSIMHSIVSWLYKTFGFGRGAIYDRVNGMFGPEEEENAANGGNAQATNGKPPASAQAASGQPPASAQTASAQQSAGAQPAGAQQPDSAQAGRVKNPVVPSEKARDAVTNYSVNKYYDYLRQMNPTVAEAMAFQTDASNGTQSTSGDVQQQPGGARATTVNAQPEVTQQYDPNSRMDVASRYTGDPTNGNAQPSATQPKAPISRAEAAMMNAGGTVN